MMRAIFFFALLLLSFAQSNNIPLHLRRNPELACRRAKDFYDNKMVMDNLSFLNKCYSKPYTHLEEYTYWLKTDDYKRTGSVVIGTNTTSELIGALICARGSILCFSAPLSKQIICEPLKSLDELFKKYNLYYPPGY